MTEIPVLSCNNADFDHAFLDACRMVGFVAVQDHGIEPSLLADMHALVARLFALSEARKQELLITRDNYRGFIPMGFFSPNRPEINGAAPDQYEGFKLHWECPPDHPVRSDCHLYGANRWVPEMPEMRDLIVRYWAGCSDLAHRLMQPFADYLGVAELTSDAWFGAPLTNMTLLHYPPRDPMADPSGMHAHKDTNVLTILAPDPVGGLQVRDRLGGWIEAAPPPMSLLVNIGEMLELWSGGEFTATPHRVANPSTTADRYAFPWFLVPSHDVTVAPLVPCVDDYPATAMPVGKLSAEVWRTNWSDEAPSDTGFDLGSLDRT